MRLILRVLGTWLLGIGVVLAVIDGTRSLASNTLVMTPLSELWAGLHAQSLVDVEAFLASRMFAPMLEQAFAATLAFPAFGVFAIPGLVFALAGRTPTRQIGQFNEI